MYPKKLAPPNTPPPTNTYTNMYILTVSNVSKYLPI